MKTQKNTMERKIFQLKIALVGSRPIIWRRILFSAEENFYVLHLAIQDAFEWGNGHLHQFFTGDPYRRSTSYERIVTPDMGGGEDSEFFEGALNEDEELIANYLKKPKSIVWYEYDLGDSWMHTIVLEKILSRDAKKEYPLILAGKNAAPLEDCGGMGGYYRLLEVTQNPKDPEYKDMREWFGLEKEENIDPKKFDPKEIKFLR